MSQPDWTRVSKCAGYPAVYYPEHNRAWSTGYVHIHVVVAEQMLGRNLRPEEVVHHRDHDPNNYAEDNLQVLTYGEHNKTHRPAKWITLTCDSCGSAFERRANQRPNVKGYKANYCSRECYYNSLRK